MRARPTDILSTRLGRAEGNRQQRTSSERTLRRLNPDAFHMKHLDVNLLQRSRFANFRTRNVSLLADHKRVFNQDDDGLHIRDQLLPNYKKFFRGLLSEEKARA